MNTLRPTPDCPDKGFITYYNIRFPFRPPGNAFKHLYRISKEPVLHRSKTVKFEYFENAINIKKKIKKIVFPISFWCTTFM